MPFTRYGERHLTTDDFDLSAKPQLGHGRYEGQDLPGPTDPGYVKQLQEDLLELGFALVGTADGDFGVKTELALREFQSYARLPFTAKQVASNETYADGLEQSANPVMYSGPVSGSLNRQTAESIVAWLANQHRCPVVIEARSVRRGVYDPTVTPLDQNIWWAREVTSSAPRMYAVDFTGRYDSAPSDFRDDNGRITLGEASASSIGIGGPASRTTHSLASAEILPDTLTEKAWVSMDQAERSTFRVIRAVADLECMGVFDSLNAYDSGVISVGPYHHILFSQRGRNPNSKVVRGELGAFLAYLQRDVPQAYERLLTDNGVGFRPVAGNQINWSRESSLRVYTAMVNLQTASGNFEKPVNKFALSEWFRSWHWFYRFSTAARVDEDFRRGFWFITRLRLWDILNAEWDGESIVKKGDGSTRKLLIGDVFRSEVAVAILLRFHVSYPAAILKSGKAAPLLRWVLESAAIEEDLQKPQDWSNAEEVRLIAQLRDAIENGYEEKPGVRLKQVKGWTIPHAEKLIEWPISQGRRYSGRNPTSKLGPETDQEALQPLSRGRQFGFKMHSPEWGAPIWE